MPIQLQRRLAPPPAAADAPDAPPAGRHAPDAAEAPDAAVRLDGVAHAYAGSNGRTVPALADLSLAAAPGELVAVVGPSGCGKSTLLELVCRLQPVQRGSLAAAPAVLMPQRDLLLPWLDALDNAALALRIAGRRRADARDAAAALFGELGLDGFGDARPHELSGGMRQRVAFARTLLSGKPVLCLDEPFGALDALTRAEMQRWLAGALAEMAVEADATPRGAHATAVEAGATARGAHATAVEAGATARAHGRRTVLLVTHDVEEAVLLADRVAVLSARPGRVVAELSVDLPRPRSRTDPAVLALRERALSALGDGMAVA